jgi:uncharacterized glyoxalase superfamily protein PhnB
MSKLQKATPVFLVSDIVETMRWYKSNLGFEAMPFPDNPPHSFCILSKDDVEIFLQQLTGYQKPDDYERRQGGVWSVYLMTKNVRDLYERLSNAAEVRILEPLCHQPYGQTEFVVRDPNGYALVFAEPD